MESDNKEQYHITECPNCKKEITDILGVDDKCPYCNTKIFENDESKKRFWSKIVHLLEGKKFYQYLSGGLWLVIVILALTLSNVYANQNRLQSNLNDVIDQYNDIARKYESLESDYLILQDKNEKHQDELDEINKKHQDELNAINESLSDLQKRYDELNAEKESLQSQLNTRATTNNSISESGVNGGRLPVPGGGGYGGMVWISATGSKYHSKPDCGTMNPNTATQISQSSAVASGYSACSKCY